MFNKDKPQVTRIFVNGKEVEGPLPEEVKVVVVEPVPTKILPPYTENARCSKCAYDAVGTQYKQGAHQQCVLGGRFGWWPGMSKQEIAEQDAVNNSIPEHLDRTCSRCQYQWAEAVIKNPLSDPTKFSP
jgi:hypothetical protein